MGNIRISEPFKLDFKNTNGVEYWCKIDLSNDEYKNGFNVTVDIQDITLISFIYEDITQKFHLIDWIYGDASVSSKDYSIKNYRAHDYYILRIIFQQDFIQFILYDKDKNEIYKEKSDNFLVYYGNLSNREFDTTIKLNTIATKSQLDILANDPNLDNTPRIFKYLKPEIYNNTDLIYFISFDNTNVPEINSGVIDYIGHYDKFIGIDWRYVGQFEHRYWTYYELIVSELMQNKLDFTIYMNYYVPASDIAGVKIVANDKKLFECNTCWYCGDRENYYYLKDLPEYKFLRRFFTRIEFKYDITNEQYNIQFKNYCWEGRQKIGDVIGIDLITLDDGSVDTTVKYRILFTNGSNYYYASPYPPNHFNYAVFKGTNTDFNRYQAFYYFNNISPVPFRSDHWSANIINTTLIKNAIQDEDTFNEIFNQVATADEMDNDKSDTSN